MYKYSDALARAVAKGLISEDAAGRVAQQLKLKPRALKVIGEGYESINQLRTSPDHGLQVAKIFKDDELFWSPEGFARRAKIMERMKGNPFFAEYYGKHPTKPIIYQEYLKQDPTKARFLTGTAKDKRRIRGYYKRMAGEPIVDIHKGNMINDKLYDFMAVSPFMKRTFPNLVSPGRFIDRIKNGKHWSVNRRIGRVYNGT